MAFGLSPQIEVDRILSRVEPPKQEDSPELADLDQLTSNLGAHIRRRWNSARLAKQKHETDMLSALRQREGIYDPDIARSIEAQGGSAIYMLLTQLKCRATEAWILEVLFQKGELPFGIKPTPVPDVPDQVDAEVRERVAQEAMIAIQQGLYPNPSDLARRVEEVETIILEQINHIAAERAGRMEKYLADILTEGGWLEELEELVVDFVTYPACFMKGPFNIIAEKLSWTQDPSGLTVPQVTRQPVRRYKRVSPFDMYPGADSRSLNDGDLIERMKLRRSSLYNLIGLPGYDETAIRQAISDYGESGYRLGLTNDSERNRLEGREHADWADDVTIDAINYWGEVRGKWLMEWGVNPSVINDPERDYEANILVVGRHIIRAALNPHPLGERPYSSESFEKANGKIWGKGIPQLLKDVQDMCNAAARSLSNNMALASGPMVEILIDRLAQGEAVSEIYPWRQIQTTESKVGTGGSARAIHFYQPNSNAQELMAVYKFFSALADEYTGIPPYAMGMNIHGGAASTATGFSMLVQSAARGVKRAIKSLDRIIESSVRRTFHSVMIHDPVPELKGDLKIVPKGSASLLNKEQQNVRRTELLQVITNPLDAEVVQLEGRRKLLWEMFKGMDMDPSEILPTKDQLARMLAERQQAEQLSAPEPEKARQTDAAGNVAGGGDVRGAGLFSG